jgi:uncharacterized membrane protein
VSLLIFAILVIVIAGLLVWLVDMIALPQPFNVVARVLILIVAVIVIGQRAGVI